MSDDARANQLDARFYRAIITGLLVGAPTAWAVLTLLFSITTETGWESAVGYSALPALVVGPFLGGLITTTLADQRATAELAAESQATRPDAAVDEAMRAA